MHGFFPELFLSLDRSARSKALKITFIYALIGSIYILVSDQLVNLFVHDPSSVVVISMAKGWIYVFATSLLIYTLVCAAMKKISDAFFNIKKMNRELEKKEAFNRAVMDNLPIGIAVNAVSPKVEFVYMNDNFPLFYRTTREELNVADMFWEAVYEDADFRSKIKQKVMADIASGDPGRMIWENIPLTRKGKVTRYISAYGTPVPGEDMIVSTVIDVTERKRAEENLIHLSYHDHLTELYNRRFFEIEINRLDAERNLPITIVIGDVNGLKMINDSFGHEVGDRLLKETAKVIKDSCRADDIIARIGGDEFGIILTKTDKLETEKMIMRITKQAQNAGLTNFILSVSFGFATKHTKSERMRDIIAEAENFMYKHKMYESASMRNKTVDIIMSALFEKSEREMQHSKRVSVISAAIAAELKFSQDEINKIRIAGLVHDIGKIGIDEKILNKADRLNEDEWKEIKKHPEAGWRILSSVNDFSDLAKHILSHHERWDGTGYPKGLCGDEITVEARIISLADAYDAMTKDRPYRNCMSSQEAMEEINRNAGTQFDPWIVDVFLNNVFPKFAESKNIKTKNPDGKKD